jgi:hypothetical protein
MDPIFINLYDNLWRAKFVELNKIKKNIIFNYKRVFVVMIFLPQENQRPWSYPNGFKTWILNGQFHREDGPAKEYADGDNYWYLNGKLHREDGAAIEWANGDKWWYLNDEFIPCTTQKEFERLMRLRAFW